MAFGKPAGFRMRVSVHPSNTLQKPSASLLFKARREATIDETGGRRDKEQQSEDWRERVSIWRESSHSKM